MQFFRVKNWGNLQHYRNRTPPWIKLYNDLLEDYEFACLQDASKLHLIMIWLLASRNNNRLPYDERWIRRKIGVDQEVNLDELMAHGFIELEFSNDAACDEVLQDASTPPATGKRDDDLEGEGEGEREQRKPIALSDADTGPVVLVFPTNKNGQQFPITESMCSQWRDLYPAVDIGQQLRNMLGWLNSNPTRRKTARGLPKFINNWLAKEQDKGGGNARHQPSAGRARIDHSSTDW